MTPRPFLLRVLLPFGLIMALIVVMCGSAIYWSNQHAVRGEQVRQLDNLATLVHPWVAGSGAALDAERQARLRTAAEALRTRVTLIDGGGRVFFDTHREAGVMENHNDRPEVIAARQGRSGSDVRESRTIREGSVYVARLLDPGVAGGTVVRLSYPQRYWADLRTPAWIGLSAGVACALAATALLARVLLRQWTSQLALHDVAALAEAAQMKSDFVANASHELRTPIAAIKIAFETLRDVYAEDPEQGRRCMTIIDGHMGRLEEMLRDLLDLSRVESATFKPSLAQVKTADLFAQVRSTLGPAARERGVELKLVDGPALLRSDERLLNLVLKNLVENSVKFTPAGGRVTVALESDEHGGDRRGAAPAGVRVRVADTGAGIPPEHLDRVFERFYQVDAARSGSAGRGTGLGLAIVKHAVAALGGTVNIQSIVGRGTTVTCTLPPAAGPHPAANGPHEFTEA